MLTQDQLKICNELVELYKVQLPLLEPTDANAAREWTIADVELYDRRAERIAKLQRQLMTSIAVNPVTLKASRTIPGGTWSDR